MREKPVRRFRAMVSTLGITSLHLRNPWVIAFWSLMFPGLGHLLLSKFLRGFLLFGWEVIINLQAHINLAILYSFQGQFDLAKQVLDPDWMLLYIPTYIFAIWDSYRTTVDTNKAFLLAAREDADIQLFRMNAIEFNYLDKSPPWITFAWSMLMPGAGQLYIHRIITAFFILIWWIVIVYESKLLPGIHASMLGNFAMATALIEPQWFLNIPSVYFFGIYDSYVYTVENNKLYEWEQAKYFKNNYQPKGFRLPLAHERGEGMYIISTFEHSNNLELAITTIQMKGIAPDKILVVPLDKRTEDKGVFDSIHHSDGISTLDLAIIMAAFLSLMGAIYGFLFTWGPVIWGLTGMVAGGALGLALKIILIKKQKQKQAKTKGAEVVLIIECLESQLEMVKDILWTHFAIGVRKLALD